MDPLAFETLDESIVYWAKQQPQREAFTFCDRHGVQSVCCSDELHQMAGRFATRLRKQGFQPGDVICNAIPNSMERLVTDFGIILAGCVGLHCQVVQEDGGDFWHTASLSKTVAAIVPVREDNPPYRLFKSFLPSGPAIPESGFVDVSIPQAPTLKFIFLVDRYSPSEAPSRKLPSLINSLKSSQESVFTHKSQSSSDLAYIFLTSGSTGFCKLVPRSHQDILQIAKSFGSSSVDITEDKYFNDRLFGWTGGFPFRYFSIPDCVVSQDSFDGHQAQNPRELWNIIARMECGKAFMVLGDVLDLVEEYKSDPPEFRLNILIIGGQPLTKAVTEALGLLTNYLIPSYASTEASVVTNLFLADKSQYQDFMCGTPFADSQIRIVDENMVDVKPDTKGKVLLKSSRVFRGYYNQIPTASVFTADGWYITGDRGWLNEDGNLFVMGRDDNVIHQGIVLIYPSWPESILNTHPDVQEAVVIGVPDGSGKNRLCACVVLREKPSALTKDVLSDYYEKSFVTHGRQEYIPRLSFIEFLNEIPKTYTSKVDMRNLRSVVYAKLGISHTV